MGKKRLFFHLKYDKLMVPFLLNFSMKKYITSSLAKTLTHLSQLSKIAVGKIGLHRNFFRPTHKRKNKQTFPDGQVHVHNRI